MYAASPELQRALDNPLVPHEAKKAILADVADRAAGSTVVKNTLFLLGDRRRMHALPAIAQLLREMSDCEEGVLRAEVDDRRPPQRRVLRAGSRRSSRR